MDARTGSAVAVHRNPVESPVERADDPILGDRREAAFPVVEKSAQHVVEMSLTASTLH
jgi:hypothetical protein